MRQRLDIRVTSSLLHEDLLKLSIICPGKPANLKNASYLKFPGAFTH